MKPVTCRGVKILPRFPALEWGNRDLKSSQTQLPFLIIAAVIVAAALFLSSRKGQAILKGRHCRWTRKKFRSQKNSIRWICSTCSAEVFSTDGRTPRICKRAYRDTSSL